MNLTKVVALVDRLVVRHKALTINLVNDLIDEIAVAIEQARREVYEECAQRMDRASQRPGSVAEEIAAEFRARAQEQP